MGARIRTDKLSVATARASLEHGVDAYCSFRLTPLSAALPVSGSADHDGRLRGCLEAALASYRAMMRGDVAALEETHDALAVTDAALAAAWGKG